MNDISIKYNLLNKTAKQEIADFIDFLLTKNKKEVKKATLSNYKKKILQVSVWTEKDLKIFDNNKKLMGQWKVEKS